MKQQKLEKHSALYIQLLEWTCQAHSNQKSKQASATCSNLLSLKPDSLPALHQQGLDFSAKGEHEAAERVLRDVFEKGGRTDRDVLESLQKAQRDLKRSKSKDYYKVLSVSPDADDRTIKKA